MVTNMELPLLELSLIEKPLPKDLKNPFLEYFEVLRERQMGWEAKIARNFSYRIPSMT